MAQARGILILAARAYPLETGLAYGPIVDAFGRFLRELRPTRRAALARGLSALGRLFADLDLGPSEPVGDPAVEKVRLFEAVARLAERLAADRPVLVLVDDVHCADPSSLELVHYVARGIRGAEWVAAHAQRLEQDCRGARMKRACCVFHAARDACSFYLLLQIESVGVLRHRGDRA